MKAKIKAYGYAVAIYDGVSWSCFDEAVRQELEQLTVTYYNRPGYLQSADPNPVANVAKWVWPYVDGEIVELPPNEGQPGRIY